MNDNVIKAFEERLNMELLGVVISNSSQKELMIKIKIRPILLKGDLYFQVSEYKGEKIFHSNFLKEALIEKLPDWFEGLFRQAEITTTKGQTIILISKKGNATIKHKENRGSNNSFNKDSSEVLQHNKTKNYILQEGTPLPFLIDLGVMTKDGLLIKAKSDKFKQINRFLEYIEDVLPYLDETKELTILDFGCGKSYLTFVMYYYLKVLKGYRINVIGLDLKADVIEECSSLSKKYGYEKMNFMQGDIASYDGSSSVDMVVTLHACDTATDHALYKAVSWGAKVILSVPCCQHELNGQIHCEMLNPLLKYGIIKERMSALMTDALRAGILETKGYRVQLLEFIDMKHTPKNILIRAVKRNAPVNEIQAEGKELRELENYLGVSSCLKRLFDDETVEEGK